MKVIIKLNTLVRQKDLELLKRVFLDSLDKDGMLLLPAGCEVIVLDKDDTPNIMVLGEEEEYDT